MNCKKCGTENPEENKFCKNCGKKLVVKNKKASKVIIAIVKIVLAIVLLVGAFSCGIFYVKNADNQQEETLSQEQNNIENKEEDKKAEETKNETTDNGASTTNKNTTTSSTKKPSTTTTTKKPSSTSTTKKPSTTTTKKEETTTNTNSSETNKEETQTPTTPEPTKPPRPSQPAKMLSAELKKDSIGYEITGIIENISDYKLFAVNITYYIYDKDGIKLGEANESVYDIEAHQKAKFTCDFYFDFPEGSTYKLKKFESLYGE